MIWLATLAVAVLIALDKSFLPGAAMVGIGLLAGVVPAKQASGTTLALLIVADWVAIWAYRKDVDRRALRQLLPNVVVGVVLGAGFLLVASDQVTRRAIGLILLVFILVNLAAMRRVGRRAQAADLAPTARTGDGPGVTGPDGRLADTPPDASAAGAAAPRRTVLRRVGFGALAGFTTMVANAGGPVTSMYFLSEGFGVMRFLGTTAWFYLIVNLVKLPFSVGLGMIGPATLGRVVVMVPVIVLTVLAGRRLARRVNRGTFGAIVVALTLVTAIGLLV